MRKLCAMIVLAAIATPVLAQDMPSGRELDAMLGDTAQMQPSHKTEVAKDTDTEPHPVASTDAAWAGSLLIVIAAMFAAAAFIGPGLSGAMPSAMQPGDDAHGHGHDHGHGGGHDDHGGGHGHH